MLLCGKLLLVTLIREFGDISAAVGGSRIRAVDLGDRSGSACRRPDLGRADFRWTSGPCRCWSSTPSCCGCARAALLAAGKGRFASPALLAEEVIRQTRTLPLLNRGMLPCMFGIPRSVDLPSAAIGRSRSSENSAVRSVESGSNCPAAEGPAFGREIETKDADFRNKAHLDMGKLPNESDRKCSPARRLDAFSGLRGENAEQRNDEIDRQIRS